MRRLLMLCVVAVVSFSMVLSNDISDGYNLFIKNKLKESRESFIKASQVIETKAEANLMLAILATIDKENEAAFDYFLNFYNSSPNPEPYIMALWHHQCIIGYESVKTKAQVKWMESLLDRPNLNTTLKADICEDLAKHYEAMQNLKKSREYFARIGSVMDWQIVGDFENISASGFDKNYAPIKHPESGYIFKNKIGADVQWFNLTNQVPGRWIDFTNNFYCNNTLIFAQTFCQSPADQTVNFRVGTSGSLKVWVNDQLIFSEDDERNNGIDTYVFPAKLNKGDNRILLQVGCSEITQCNFMFRVTDNKDILKNDLTYSTTYQKYNKAIGSASSLIISTAEEYFLKQIKDNPQKLVNYIVLANAYLANDKKQDALNILLEAQKVAPDCSYLLYQMAEFYIRDKNRTSFSLTQEKLKQVDPENPLVLNTFINEAFEKENYVEARQLIEKKEKLYADNKDLAYYKIRLASAENKPEDYAKFINLYYKKYSSDYNFVYQKYNYEKNVKHNEAEAISCLEKYTDKFFDKNALGTLTGEYFQANKVNKGFEKLNLLIEYLPFSENYNKYMADAYTELANYKLAEKNYNVSLKVAPYYGPYHGSLARVFELSGDTAKAIAEYTKNVSYQPDDYESIKKLRSLRGLKAAFDYFPEKNYDSIYKNSPSASDYPSDNFISLTEERQTILYENGGSEMKQILMFKVLTQRGIDYVKEYNIPSYSNEKINIEKAQVLKKNGNKLQAEIKDNQVVYTSLEPGDAVLLIYKKEKYVSGDMSKNFYEKYLLNSWYPSLNIEYSILAAKNQKFEYKLINSQVKPVITENGQFNLYLWKKVNNKAILSESYMPPMTEIGELLSISTLPDWDFVSKWYYDISNTKTKPGFEVKQLVNELLKGKEHLNEMQKARIFYNFITQNIRYSSVSFRQSGIVPQKASDVLITRIGDCKDLSILFNSMCREAGIKSWVILVNRRENGSNFCQLPSFEFDHAIAKAKLDGTDYYIELTSPYFPFSTMGDNLLKAFVLEINNDTANKIVPITLNPTSRQPNKIYRDTKVTFQDTKMNKNISTIRIGDQAAYTRSAYRDLGKDEREKKFTQAVSGEYPNTKLNNLTFAPNLFDCSDSVTYTYSCSSPNVFSNIGELSIVKLPITDPLTPLEFLSNEERKFPIEAWYYNTADTIVENLTISIPPNKILAEVPKSVEYWCKQANYKISYKLKGNELLVNRSICYGNDIVTVEDYKEYRSFIEKVVKSDSQQIGFRQNRN